MGKIRVADGTLVDPYAPTDGDVKLDVFAHSLATINRFTGHAKFPLSVGQHTLNLRYAVNAMGRNYGMAYDHIGMLERAALAHDMSEAWFNDMASPVKKENPNYRDAEHEAGMFIAGHLGIPRQYMHDIDPLDKRIYKNERDAMFPIIRERGMGDNYVPLPASVMPNWAFVEFDWRTVRKSLWFLFRLHFPFNAPDVPFWERSEYIG